MVKWEQYNSLTTKQKEEYNYKFQDKSYAVDLNYPILLLMIFMLIAVLVMFIAVMSNTLPVLAKFQYNTEEFMRQAAKTMQLSSTVFIIAIIISVGERFWNVFQRNKWLKNIKR